MGRSDRRRLAPQRARERLLQPQAPARRRSRERNARDRTFLELMPRATESAQSPECPSWLLGIRGSKPRNINGLPDAVGVSALGRKMTFARLENGEGHETAAITPPLKRGGFRPCAQPLVPSFRPFCGVSMTGLNTRGKVPPGRS